MSLPSFIKIKRGSDGGPCPQTEYGASFCSKFSEYQCFEVCRKTSSCAEVQIGAHVIKLNKVPVFVRNQVNIKVSRSADPKTSSFPSMSILLHCKLVTTC